MTTQIVLAGCGALGSRIALNIVTPDMQFVLIDNDKVAIENIGTSAYDYMDIGRDKTVALYGKLVDAIIPNGAYPTEHKLKDKRIRSKGQILSSTDMVNPGMRFLIIDAFDNGKARNLTADAGKWHNVHVDVVHIGVSPQGIGSIEWNATWQRMDERETINEVCTHEVGRSLILLTSTVASIIINTYLQTGEMKDAYVDVNKISVYQ